MNRQSTEEHEVLETISAKVSKIGTLQVRLQQSLWRSFETANLVSTQADRVSQEALITLLQRLTPEYGIIAEENLFERPSSCQRLWCIDPLDGTANYAVGLPLWCISICLLENYVPIWALVHVPPGRDTYYAARGRGAFRNGQRLVVKDTRISRTLFSFPIEKYQSRPFLLRRLTQLEAIANQVGDIRTFNATALELCYIASGQLGGLYVEQTARIWDICGGMLILQEAGGKVSTPDGTDLLLSSDTSQTYSVFAGIPTVYGSLLGIVSG